MKSSRYHTWPAYTLIGLEPHTYRMWREDRHGTELDSVDEAREELRRRAQLAIGAGLKAGHDVRHKRIRLRNQQGSVLFDGTLAEAAACDAPFIKLGRPTHFDAVVREACRLRAETSRLCTLAAERAVGFELLRTRITEQIQLSRDLVRASQVR